MGAAAVGATLTVYATARLLMNIPAGLLADRFGRRPLLVWGPAITAAGAAISDVRCFDLQLWVLAALCVLHSRCRLDAGLPCSWP